MIVHILIFLKISRKIYLEEIANLDDTWETMTNAHGNYHDTFKLLKKKVRKISSDCKNNFNKGIRPHLRVSLGLLWITSACKWIRRWGTGS